MKETNDNQAGTRKRPRILLVLTGAAAIAITALLVEKINAPGHSLATASNGPVRVDSSQSAGLQPLMGRWVRMDTPYVFEITGAGSDGKLKAGYYNPRPINIARAEARDKNGELEVFVELRDVYYPGSTYNLTYDRTRDLLRGVYFQAVSGRKYDVVFGRIGSKT